MTDFICPKCGGALTPHGEAVLTCEQDSLSFHRENGIWRFLTPRLIAHYKAFIRDYETIRQAEGRGSSDPEFYRALPFEDRSGNMPKMWQMRAASFKTFMDKAVRPLPQKKMSILELGAGNGWLSNRLALLGHSVDAVDLLTNDWDGLGAHVHYESAFRPVQAAFDALPFKSHRYDLIVFNASFHYSEDFDFTFNRVLKLLTREGVLAIMDTPVYSREESGFTMVNERKKAFKEAYGFASDALPLENFLTEIRLQRMLETHHLEMQRFEPYFGLKRAVLPYWERLRGRREPARFPVIVLKKKK